MLFHLLWTIAALALWYTFVRVHNHSLRGTLILAILSHISIIVLIARIAPVDLLYDVLRHIIALYNDRNTSWLRFIGTSLGVFVLFVRMSNPDMFEGKAGRYRLFILAMLFYYPITTVLGLVIAVYDKLISEACLGEIYWDSTYFAFHLGLALMLSILLVNFGRTCRGDLGPTSPIDTRTAELENEGDTTANVARGPGGYPNAERPAGSDEDSDSDPKIVQDRRGDFASDTSAYSNPGATQGSNGFPSPTTGPELNPSFTSASKSRPARLSTLKPTTPAPSTPLRPTRPLRSAVAGPTFSQETSRPPLFTLARSTGMQTRKPGSILRNPLDGSDAANRRKNPLNPLQSQWSSSIRDAPRMKYQPRSTSLPLQPTGKDATHAGAKKVRFDDSMGDVGSPMTVDDYTFHYQKATSPVTTEIHGDWAPSVQSAPADQGERLKQINARANKFSEQTEMFRTEMNARLGGALQDLRTNIIAPLEELEHYIGQEHDSMHTNLSERARELESTTERMMHVGEAYPGPAPQQRDARRTSDEPWGKAAIRQLKQFDADLGVYQAKVAQVEAMADSVYRRSKCKKNVARLELIVVFLRGMQLHGHPGLSSRRETQCGHARVLIEKLKKLAAKRRPESEPVPHGDMKKTEEDADPSPGEEMDTTENIPTSEPEVDTTKLIAATKQQIRNLRQMLESYGRTVDAWEKNIEQPPTEQTCNEAKQELKEKVIDPLEDMALYSDFDLEMDQEELTDIALKLGDRLDQLAEKSKRGQVGADASKSKDDSGADSQNGNPFGLGENELVQSSSKIHGCVKEVHNISQQWKMPPKQVDSKLVTEVARVCDHVGWLAKFVDVLTKVKDERVLQLPANIGTASEKMITEITKCLRNVQMVDERINTQTISQLNHLQIHLEEVGRNITASKKPNQPKAGSNALMFNKKKPTRARRVVLDDGDDE